MPEAVITKPAPLASLPPRELVQDQRFIRQLQLALPRTFSASRMARVALTAMTRVANLDRCDQQSIARCLLDLAQLGLEPDGRFAHLIPFKNNKRNTYECQLIVDYRGYVQLAYRSGMVKSIYADVVHEGDDFAFERGQVVRHTKWEWRSKSSRPEMRGELIGAYASVYLVNGGEAHLALTVHEIEAVRARSKSRDNGPWVTDFEAMARKTAFKRLTKWIPLSEADFVAALRRRNCIGFVAESGERIVGFMIYELEPNRIRLMNIAVCPDHRRIGIGSHLVRKLVSKLSLSGRDSLALEVRETNVAAQLFFRSLGFRAVSILRDYYDQSDEDAYAFVIRANQVRTPSTAI